jgi:hypothetical protein
MGEKANLIAFSYHQFLILRCQNDIVNLWPIRDL